VATKAGIIGLTKSVARELGKFQVTVNAIATGLIETDMVKQAPQNVRDMALADILVGRLDNRKMSPLRHVPVQRQSPPQLRPGDPGRRGQYL